VEVPELSQSPASLHDLRPAKPLCCEMLLLLLIYRHELITHTAKFFKPVFSQVIHVPPCHPVRRLLHLNWERTSPLQINQRGDMPILINKDIALIHIGKRENEWAPTRNNKLLENRPHKSSSCYLLASVYNVIN
jgi:hypothetical protein